jgi:hypothetical protein
MDDYPLAQSTFRTIANLPQQPYDETKTTTIFAEDLERIQQQLGAVEDTLGYHGSGFGNDLISYFTEIRAGTIYSNPATYGFSKMTVSPADATSIAMVNNRAYMLYCPLNPFEGIDMVRLKTGTTAGDASAEIYVAIYDTSGVLIEQSGDINPHATNTEFEFTPTTPTYLLSAVRIAVWTRGGTTMPHLYAMNMNANMSILQAGDGNRLGMYLGSFSSATAPDPVTWASQSTFIPFALINCAIDRFI